MNQLAGFPGFITDGRMGRTGGQGLPMMPAPPGKDGIRPIGKGTSDGSQGDQVDLKGGLGQAPGRGGLGATDKPKTQTDQDKDDKNKDKSDKDGMCEADVLKLMIQHFEKIDTNGDKFLDQKEIQESGPKLTNIVKQELGSRGEEVIKNLAKDLKTLIFKNIDPGAQAWFGLSKQDLSVIKNERENKQPPNPSQNQRTLNQLPDSNTEARNRISRDRGLTDPSRGTVERYTDSVQAQILNDPSARQRFS